VSTNAAATQSRFAALFTLAIGAAIAAVVGVDAFLDLVSGGHAWRRAVLFLVLAPIGLLCARHADLRLLPAAGKFNIAIPIATGFAVAVGVTIIDAIIFRSVIPDPYVAAITKQPVVLRIFYFVSRSFNEEVFNRLVLMSAIAWALGLFWKDAAGRTRDGAYWTAIIVAQVLAIILNVIASYSFANFTPMFVLYAIVRFVLPGVIWGLIYWRCGLVTAQIAHMSTHVFLQPMLGYAL
jgi:hypothetical protein